MSNELSKELQAQIEQEARLIASQEDFHYPDDNWELTEVAQREFVSGYECGATAYATELQSEQEKRKEAEQAKEQMAFHILHLHKVVEQMKERGQVADMDFVMIKAQEALFIHDNYKSKKDGTVNG